MSFPNLALIQLRASLKARLRAYLDTEGVLEVDVPVLAKNACPDSAVHPITLSVQGTNCFLQPSPEMLLKRFLAHHPIDCYSLGPVFRNDPVTPLHNPEFFRLEFYLVGADRYEELKQKTLAIAELFVGYRAIEIMTYEEVWKNVLGLPYQPTKDYILALLKHANIDHDPHWDHATLEDLAFGTLCQPYLGQGVFTVIDGFPQAQAALAQCAPQGWAQRFELFIDGFELANGYHELIDPVQNRNRFNLWHQQRAQLGILNWPIDEKFLKSVAHLPSCSGVAIGLERLIMLASCKRSLEETLPFAWNNL